MASLKIERLQLDIIINGDKSRVDLRKMEDQMKLLNKELKKLPEGTEAWTSKVAEIKTLQSQIDKVREKIGLTGMTMRELTQRQKELNGIMRNLDPRLKEYKELDAQLKAVNARIGELKGKTQQTSGFLGQLAGQSGGFLKTMAAGLGITGGIYAVVSAFKNAFNVLKKYDEGLADIMKTTGLTKKESAELTKELLKINTRTGTEQLMQLATAAGRLNITGKENIKSFVENADKVFVALNDSLEGNAEEIATNLGKIANAFDLEKKYGIGESISRVGSTINELGSTSKASEGPIVDFVSRLQGVAATAKIAYPDLAALGALFDENGQSIEVAATTFNTFLPAIGKDLEKFARVAGMKVGDFKKVVEKDAFEALKLIAIGAKSNQQGLTGLTETLESYGVESARSAAIVSTLSNNVDRLTELQNTANKAFNENTSLNEEFAKKNETLGASGEKLSKIWDRLIISINGGGNAISEVAKGAMSLLSAALNKISDVLTDKAYPAWTQFFNLINTSTYDADKVLDASVEKALKSGMTKEQIYSKVLKEQGEKSASQVLASLARIEKRKQEANSNEINDLNKKNEAEIKAEDDKNKKINKLTDEQVKEAKKKAEELKKLQEKTQEDYLKLLDDRYKATLSDNERELLLISEKYDALLESDSLSFDQRENLRKARTEELAAKELVQRTKIEEEFQKKVKETREKYAKLTEDELYAKELSELKRVYDEKYLNTLEYEKAKAEIEDKYRIAKEIKDKEAKEKEFALMQENLAKATAIIDFVQNYFNTAKDAELAKIETNYQRELKAAGNNEAQKNKVEAKYKKESNEVKKKYADKEFAMNTAMITANMAVAIAKAWKDYGWPWALVPTAFLAATAAVQISTANQARQQVKQLAKGQNMPVVGADDGKTYNAEYVGAFQTKLYNKPSLGYFANGQRALVGEKKPEMVIDGYTTENLLMNYPEIIQAIAYARTGVRQYAEGNNMPVASPSQPVIIDNKDAELTNAVKTLNRILASGVQAKVSYKQFREVDDEYNSIIDSVSKG